MGKMQYRVVAAKVGDVTKMHEQTFTQFEVAARTRDYLRSKGYVAVVRPVVGKINAEVFAS